ncbi:hypothetical protein Ancab_015006 [Ancistrocladus abbreviatus]
MILGTLRIRPAAKAVAAPQRFRVHCSDSRIAEAKNDLGQRHHTVLVKRNSGKRSLVEWSGNGHVPSQCELIGLLGDDEGSTGFYPPRPTTKLVWRGLYPREERAGHTNEDKSLVGCSREIRPKRGGAKSNKSEKESLNRNVRATTSSRSTMKKAGNTPKQSRQEVDEAEILGFSIRESNIENMNRIFLLNLNRVSAKDIWEVGQKTWGPVSRGRGHCDPVYL